MDDTPFERTHRGDVSIVGVHYSGLRLVGVCTGRVRRDGANATARIAQMVQESKFGPQVGAVLLQGIAVAGFNVVDIHRLSAMLAVPVVVVARRQPNMAAIQRALLTRVQGGQRKWKLVQKAGEMEPMAGIFVQRAGVDRADAAALIRSLTVDGSIPEPIRAAHLIAGAISRGESTGRA